MKAKTVVKENPIITTTQAAELLGMTPRNVQILCASGKIRGAVKFGRDWAIPNPPIIEDKDD
jgi:helix-turn-helix protein